MIDDLDLPCGPPWGFKQGEGTACVYSKDSSFHVEKALGRTAVGLGSRRAGPRGCRPREGRRRQPRCGMRERDLPEGQEGSAAAEEVGSE